MWGRERRSSHPVWAPLYMLDNGKTQYDSCLLNYNIQYIAGCSEQGEPGSDINPSWQHNQHCYLMKRQDFPVKRHTAVTKCVKWLHVQKCRKTFKEMKTQTQTHNKLSLSCMRIHIVVVVGCDNYCNSSESECPWSSAQNIVLFHFWFMFWRDNFLVPLIRASPGTVLKLSFPTIIEEHDKVHISLIMEALGKYKEPVSHSHTLNAQIYCRF